MFPNDPPGLQEMQDRHEQAYRRARQWENVLLAAAVIAGAGLILYAYFYWS